MSPKLFRQVGDKTTFFSSPCTFLPPSRVLTSTGGAVLPVASQQQIEGQVLQHLVPLHGAVSDELRGRLTALCPTPGRGTRRGVARQPQCEHNDQPGTHRENISHCDSNRRQQGVSQRATALQVIFSQGHWRHFHTRLCLCGHCDGVVAVTIRDLVIVLTHSVEPSRGGVYGQDGAGRIRFQCTEVVMRLSAGGIEVVVLREVHGVFGDVVGISVQLQLSLIPIVLLVQLGEVLQRQGRAVWLVIEVRVVEYESSQHQKLVAFVRQLAVREDFLRAVAVESLIQAGLVVAKVVEHRVHGRQAYLHGAD
mmetsp:Transcript_19757/g.33236  ORF Transcript_19757/g.33236 Transcript_19757/m.33236 type:complete len:308 (-) Transcript_19757:595-1518(-)